MDETWHGSRSTNTPKVIRPNRRSSVESFTDKYNDEELSQEELHGLSSVY